MTTYTFSHYLQPFLLLPGLNFLIISCGLIVWRFWSRIGKFIVLLGFVSLWLLSTPIVTYQLIGILQNQYPILKTESLVDENINAKIQKAIVVLGGGDSVAAEYNNKRIVDDFTLHRIKYAAFLHQKTHLPIIVSGGRTFDGLESQADLMAKVLLENYHINADMKEDKSLTTADEGKLIASLLKKNKIGSIYLVTNAWHMPRSVFIFHCAGINVIPAPMGHFVYGPGYALISFFPNIESLYASSIAIHEFIGLIWYRYHYGKACLIASL